MSDRIEIQYIAHNSFDGTAEWVFGSLLDTAVCETKGWVAASTLRKDRSELANPLKICIGEMVDVASECPSRPGSGYLSTKIGDKLCDDRQKAGVTTAIANDTLRHKIDYVEVLNSAL